MTTQPVSIYGTDAFRDTPDRMLELAVYAHARLLTDPRLETGPPPTLSVVTFRLRNANKQRNQSFLAALNATGQVFLSSIEAEGYWLRICLLNQRIRTEHVNELIDVITATIEAGSWRNTPRSG
ncbi:hypothetical protein [Saccharopolyspora hattusasensis]|uniref:hypothetical protein n=1 Tax=Saccharopolyspora hattusasensis TaxID=1128679 RepID=UPI003D997534